MNKLLLAVAIGATVYYHLNKKAKAANVGADQSISNPEVTEG